MVHSSILKDMGDTDGKGDMEGHTSIPEDKLHRYVHDGNTLEDTLG